jgi:Alpha/beta hydrolase of unknown function (DUF900)
VCAIYAEAATLVDNKEKPKEWAKFRFLYGQRLTQQIRAALAAYRGALVVFDPVEDRPAWASCKSQELVRGYSEDADRASASGEKMAAFLRGLENGAWQKVHLLAHSMGNRVMLNGLADNPRAATAIRSN